MRWMVIHSWHAFHSGLVSPASADTVVVVLFCQFIKQKAHSCSESAATFLSILTQNDKNNQGSPIKQALNSHATMLLNYLLYACSKLSVHVGTTATSFILTGSRLTRKTGGL